MRYQKYKTRMAKISKVLNVLYRFRIPIIATIVVSTAAALTFTGLNGTAQSVVMSQKEFQYGDDVEAFGKSTFGDADLEYSPSGKNQWSSEVPYRVGTYDVRAVSTNGFGQKTYSSPVSFDISPIPLEIELVTKINTYGNDLVFDFPNLVNGDRVDAVNYDYAQNYYTDNPFGESDTFKTSAILDTSTFKIIDSENADVTYCYEIQENTFDVEIKKRRLDIVVETSHKEYDGQELSTEGNTFVSDSTPLATGDNISINYNTSFSEVGTHSITDTVKITNGEYDRTNFYDVNYNVHELTIASRPITISTNSITRNYNGKRLSKDATTEDNLLTYSLSNTLAEKHIFKFNGFTSESLYKPIVNSINSIDYQILDENGNDITDSNYYEITENFGFITINKLDISIDYKVTEPEFFNYQTLKGGFIVNGELAENDKIVEELKDGYDTDELSTINELNYAYDFSVLNDDLGDVSECYNISVLSTHGTLVIKSVPLTLTSNSIEKIYDGIPFGDTSNTPIESRLVGQSLGLLDGHRVEFDFVYNNQLFIDGENASNTFTYSIYDQNDNEVSHIYYIEIHVGTLTTRKRDLKVRYRSNSWVFDGQYHSDGLIEGTLPDGGTNLAETDEIDFFEETPSVYFVGQYDNFADFYISHKGIDVSSYYNFPTYEEMKGNLEITKRQVFIDFNLPQSRMYDGTVTPITEDMVSFESDNFNLENYNISYGFNYGEIALYQEGGYDLEILGLNISDKDGNDLTSNFEFVIRNNNALYQAGENISLGHVDIHKRPITISTYDATKVYDSTELTSEDAANSAGDTKVYTITGDSSLAPSDTVQINKTSSITNVGKKENSILYSINNPLLGDVTNSYDIATDFGNLEVTPKSGLVINVFDVFDYTYNGTYQYASFTSNYENLEPNDYLEIQALPLYDAGTYEPEDFFTYRIINQTTGLVTTNSYEDVTIVSSTFTIHKADLSIKMMDINIDLLNENLPDPLSIANVSGLQYANILKLTYGKDAYKEVGMGKYPTIIYDVVKESDQKSVLKNYNVTYVPGIADLSLMDVELKIIQEAHYLDYQDKVLDINDCWSSDMLFSYSLPEGYYFENLSAVTDREIKEPGEYSLTFESIENLEIYRIVNGNKEYVTDKFNIIPDFTPGTVIVQKRQILVNETYFSFTYDGDYKYIPAYNFLSFDHHIEIVGYETPVDAGNYVFDIDSINDVVIKDGLGNDVTYLYEIVVDDSVYENNITMDINKVDLQIRLPAYKKTFDAQSILMSDLEKGLTYGYRLDNSSEVLVGFRNNGSCKLSTGDTLSYKTPILPSSYHVYSQEYTMEFSIKDANGNDKSNNYNLNIIPGTITIEPLEINYDAKHTSHTYNGQDENYEQKIDGKSSSNDFVTINISLLPKEVADYILSGAEGSYAVIDVYDFLVGEYSSEPTFVILYNGEDLVAKGDIVFTSSDPNVEVQITKRNLTIRNEMNQEITLSKRNPFVKEKLIVSGLAKNDTLYINGVKYSSTISDYDVIPNITVGSSEGMIYGEDYYSLYINASCIQIINESTGRDVTHCYNLNFVWYNVIVYQ